MLMKRNILEVDIVFLIAEENIVDGMLKMKNDIIIISLI
jgi:hypothetical protein